MKMESNAVLLKGQSYLTKTLPSIISEKYRNAIETCKASYIRFVITRVGKRRLF